jgi:protein transport protein SEC23
MLLCLLLSCLVCYSGILQVLQMIPEESHVGLITFGMHVHVHELGFSECSKAFVFRGSKEYTSAQVGHSAVAAAAAAAAAAVLKCSPAGLCKDSKALGL